MNTPGEAKVVSGFLEAYMADWKSRWLRPGESREDGLRRGVAAGIGFMPLTIPRPASLTDPARYAGAPDGYLAFLSEIGDAALELPFGLAMPGSDGVGWRSGDLFFASAHDGHRYFGFKHRAPTVYGFDDVGATVGAVASSFESFLKMLTFAIRAGANRGLSVGAKTWEFLSGSDATAREAGQFWRIVLEVDGGQHSPG